MKSNKRDQRLARQEKEFARYEKTMSTVNRAGGDLSALDGVDAALGKTGGFDASTLDSLAVDDAVRHADLVGLRGVLDARSAAASIAPDVASASKLGGIAAACSNINGVGIAGLAAKSIADTVGKSAVQSIAGVVAEQARKQMVPVEIPALGAFDRQVVDLRQTLAGLGGIQSVHANLRATLKPSWHVPALAGIASFNSRIDGVVGSIVRSGAGSLWQSYEDTLGRTFSSYRPMIDSSLGAILNHSFSPYLQDFSRLAMGFDQWLRSVPPLPRWGELGYKALEALEAFDSNRHWIANAFLRTYLGLPVNDDTQRALWIVLKKGFERPLSSPAPWLTLNHKNAVAYLRVAVRNEAKRIKRDREMDDRLYWRGRGGRPLYLETEQYRLPEDRDPCMIVAGSMDHRAQILDELALGGTERDKEIVRLVRGGEHTRADIRNAVGSSHLQSFERKIRRMSERRKIFL